MNQNILTQWRKAGLKTAIVLMLSAIVSLFINGLNLGVDFAGGQITRLTTGQSVQTEQMQQLLGDQLEEGFSVTGSNNNTEWQVRQSADGGQKPHGEWLKAMQHATEYAVEFLDSDYVFPAVGDELINQGGLAMMAALIAIMLYLAMRFEWRLAMGAIAALFHDVLVVMGVFALTGLEFNLTVLAAILAVIGYSLNDSIVVGDRMRELMRANKDSSLDRIVNAAIASTMTRTLITSGTTLATICAIWLLAGRPLEGFAVALFTGILVGTLSSICISATLPGFLGLEADYYQRKLEEQKALREEIP